MVKRTFAYPVGCAIRIALQTILAPLRDFGRTPKWLLWLGRYVVNILIAFDQFCNALLAGDPDETISSRIGKMITSGEGNYFTILVNDFLDGLDPNHSIDAIEPDEGDDQLV